MSVDKFFTQNYCDRCNQQLKLFGRSLSWFTEDIICLNCFKKETTIKTELMKNNINIGELEGCGYIPSI